ncbi:protective antigen-like protein, fibrinogen- and Ig-binding protein precursor [Streptococcus equi subsp. zooepidemicus Sz105]|uniref:LPXTG cell wall anchor domain-containing protein n=1 Tax=Streptococcus equi TaxID=1336 RepID=UPI0005B912FD|nr:LPXTG cell wall anchor domain-containing protein [Streptococcus equi]KIS14965.1 protective antigen-like protein, fibrinogen- and Ig-binding protein precursor [Streptococcus equi subsp. zooepidemicus Sz105]MDI5988465.1 LPXTG cell wall anchor domain-containing protein [Streptococcus equi subsp. zooepidemicus]HEL0558621.1 LPXTG cell wall anchor domain-containing protein [Streptococcus equi subsp. zooepidemicus]HEL0608329.1 LPXTG cell wall anchor domain-containing protein [Streptococcus equi sub
MKSCKSTLRKAVMAAMLAGAITTTGGVKAASSDPVIIRLLTAVVKNSDDLDDLATEFSTLTAAEMRSLFEGIRDNKKDYQMVLSAIKSEDLEPEDIFINALVDGIETQIETKEKLEKETTELLTELNQVKVSFSDLMNQLGTAKEARDKAQAEADRLSQAVDSLGRLTESAKRELTEKLAEIDQLTQDKAKAASDLETANANITTLQEELAGVKADVDKLSEEKAAADQALAEANARVSNLEQEVAAANNRVADLEAQLAEKTAELDMVKADKAELEAKVKELQSLLEQKDHNNADLQAEIKRLKQELADKFKDLSQPRAKTPQASNSVAKQKASRPAAKPAGQLPSTGEDAANPFFTAAAVAIMTGAGLVTVMPKRQKD